MEFLIFSNVLFNKAACVNICLLTSFINAFDRSFFNLSKGLVFPNLSFIEDIAEEGIEFLATGLFDDFNPSTPSNCLATDSSLLE